MFGKMGLYVIQYPTGRFGFVGRVPAQLAYDAESEEDLQAAAEFGPRLAQMIARKEGRKFDSLSWATKEEAVAYAEALGFQVVK